jgi:hypothetical protein
MIDKQRPLDRVETVSLSNELARTDSDDNCNRQGRAHEGSIQSISQKAALFERHWHQDSQKSAQMPSVRNVLFPVNHSPDFVPSFDCQAICKAACTWLSCKRALNHN